MLAAVVVLLSDEFQFGAHTDFVFVFFFCGVWKIGVQDGQPKEEKNQHSLTKDSWKRGIAYFRTETKK